MQLSVPKIPLSTVLSILHVKEVHLTSVQIQPWQVHAVPLQCHHKYSQSPHNNSNNVQQRFNNLKMSKNVMKTEQINIHGIVPFLCPSIDNRIKAIQDQCPNIPCIEDTIRNVTRTFLEIDQYRPKPILCVGTRAWKQKRMAGRPRHGAKKRIHRMQKKTRLLRYCFALEGIDYDEFKLTKRGVIPQPYNELAAKFKFANYRNLDDNFNIDKLLHPQKYFHDNNI